VLAGNIACLGALAIAAKPAWTAPPENADPGLAPWFRSLAQPGTGVPCCDIADCRQVEYRMRNGHYQAYIGNAFPRWTRAPFAWVDVPDGNVLHRRDNPTGEGVACWQGGQVICFVPASGM